MMCFKITPFGRLASAGGQDETLAIFGLSGIFNLRPNINVSISYLHPIFHKYFLISRPNGYTNGRVIAWRSTPFMDGWLKTKALCVPPHTLDLGNGQLGEAEYPSRGKPNKLREPVWFLGEKGLSMGGMTTQTGDKGEIA